MRRLLLLISGVWLLLAMVGCRSVHDNLAKENAYFDAQETKPLLLPDTVTEFKREDYYAVPQGLTSWQPKYAASLVPPTMDAANK